LEETATVLAASERNGRRYTYSNEQIVAYCQELAHIGTVVFDIPDLAGVVRDPNDDMIVACAVAAKADFLVSRDKDLLSLERYEGIRFVTPETFLMILHEGKEGPRS
jgi:uncharacterized protein